jgi:hypothetical protein
MLSLAPSVFERRCARRVGASSSPVTFSHKGSSYRDQTNFDHAGQLFKTQVMFARIDTVSINAHRVTAWVTGSLRASAAIRLGDLQQRRLVATSSCLLFCLPYNRL